MTSLEKLRAAVDGHPLDEKPIIIWPSEGMQSDAAILPLDRIVNRANKSRIVLAEVLSPFARSLQKALGLNRVLQEDPKKGEEILDGLIKQTLNEFAAARQAGADGVFYRLQGAEPTYSSPMQYGGHYLETDREILQATWKDSLNVLFVEGGPETYLDFVSDLPATIFAWDCERTEVSLATLRKLRKGALATADPEADILFGSNYGILHQWVKQGVAATNA